MEKEGTKPSIRNFRAKLSHKKRRLDFNYRKKCWNLEKFIIKKGGEEQHLTKVPGLGRKSRVQSAVIEEGYPKLKLLKFSVSIVVVFCIASVKYII